LPIDGEESHFGSLKKIALNSFWFAGDPQFAFPGINIARQPVAAFAGGHSTANAER